MDTQYALFDNKLLLGRWTMGLFPTGEAEVTDINLTPDLTEAETILQQQYAAFEALAPGDEPQTVRPAEANEKIFSLEQVLIFRRGQEQWLYSAPQRPFWGKRKTAKSRYLTLSCPERDEDLAIQLLNDLDGDIARMCATLIVSTTLSDKKTKSLLPVKALRTFLPQGLQERKIDIRSIKTSPAHPHLLLIAAAVLDEEKWFDGGGLIFSYDLLLNLPYNLQSHDEFSFSADGEWLTIRSSDLSGTESQLHLHNLTTDQTIGFNVTFAADLPGYDWSADSQWLLRAEAGFLHIYAPTHGYQRLIVHEYPRCKIAVWINK